MSRIPSAHHTVPSGAPFGLAVLASAALVGAGCEADFSPSGVGEPEPAAAPLAADEGRTFEGDMLPWPVDEGARDDFPEGAGEAAAAEPRVFFLWYADGGAPPSKSVCGGTPPKYTCTFGASPEECQRTIQALLDRYYADFNIVFTLSKPAGGRYYTEVVTSATSSWCGGVPGGVLGVAPASCADSNGGTCYAFECGSDARKCAVTVAQEQAHLVGLVHTGSRADLLTPSWPCGCDQFEDRDNSAMGGSCRSTQNSYQMMKMRLGAWPGGDKPGPFGPSGGGGSGGGGADGGDGSGGMGGGAGGGGSGGGAGGSAGGGMGGGSGGGGAGGGGSGGGAGGSAGGGAAGADGTAGQGGGGGGAHGVDVQGGCGVGRAGAARAAAGIALLAAAPLRYRRRRCVRRRSSPSPS